MASGPRKPDEDYDEYKQRLKDEEQSFIRHHVSRMFHVSKQFFNVPAKDNVGTPLLDGLGNPQLKQVSHSETYRRPAHHQSPGRAEREKDAKA